MLGINTLLFFGLGGQEILIIALIVLLLFGGSKIPELMRGPVPYGPHDFAPLLKGEGTPVKYVQQLSK